jgi:hypothetical protein
LMIPFSMAIVELCISQLLFSFLGEAAPCTIMPGRNWEKERSKHACKYRNHYY